MGSNPIDASDNCGLQIDDFGLSIGNPYFLMVFHGQVARQRVCKTLLMGFPLRGITQVPSTPLTIADCGLMIADGQPPICNLLW
jgi:hypothetical protein